MGLCPDCGSPCPHCSPKDETSLLLIDKSVRGYVQALINDFGYRTAQQQGEFITQIVQYPAPKIRQAYMKWKRGGYASRGRPLPYFMAILKNCVIEKGPLLEDLPPLFDPDKEAGK